jgi:DNA polymerase I
MDSVMLIDGKNFLFRNYFAHQMLATSTGEDTGALFGCLNGLLFLSKRLPEVPLVFVWDGGGETWRHRLLKPKPLKVTQVQSKSWLDKQIGSSMTHLMGIDSKVMVDKVEGYKATRPLQISAEQRPKYESAVKQLPELSLVLRNLGIRQFRIPRLEGDDLLGLLATRILKEQWFEEVIIHSTDKDFYQLLSMNGLRLLRGTDSNGELMWMTARDVSVENQVSVKDWVKYRALVGDKSDNIPQAMEKLGPKTAVKFLSLGVDASLKSFDELPEKARSVLLEFGKGVVDPLELWPRVRKNYLASHIVKDPKFAMFSSEVREKVNELMVGLSRESFLRAEGGKSEDAYREFTEWCVRREMPTLKARRDELLKLC